MAEATEPTTKEPSSPDGPSPTSGNGRSQLSLPVFIGSAALIIAFVLWAWLAPENAESVIFGVTGWVARNLGWYYVLTAGIIVVFVLIVAFSRVGRTKIGPDHSSPKFNLFTWTAMLFAAGIGVDLMFFAVSGPAANFLTPPEGTAESMEAARQASLWTMFHYGIPGWAMYALMGMAFGLFAYRYHLPLSIRSALYPIVGRRVNGAAGDAVEIAAIIGTIFGIATSLGIGVVFLNYGLSYLFGWEEGPTVQVALIVLAVIITTISTVSGVEKGIRRLSELNVVLAVILLVYVLVAGHTQYLLNALVQNIGDFFARFPSMLFNTFAYADTTGEYTSADWMTDWTLFFWAWWIAWAPFVGLFLARISRGRTLRQFVIGTLIIPFTFILLWISIFGNAAMELFRGGADEFLTSAAESPESSFYTLLLEYPGASFAIAVTVLTGLLFYVTSADSGSLVMANFTSRSTDAGQDGAAWLRIFWSGAIGALTLVMLFIDGVYTLQSATIIMGLPFSVVMYLIMVGVWRALRRERLTVESREASLSWVLSSRARESVERGGWRRRLARHMTFPNAAQVTEFLNEVGVPAVEEVADELQAQGADVSCSRGTAQDTDIPTVDLHVRFRDSSEFKYQIYPVAYSLPSFANNPGTVESNYYRAEIFSATGSRGHDIMGYTKEQVITDILDAYEHHLTFLTMSGDHATTLGEDIAIPDEWEDADSVEDKA